MGMSQMPSCGKKDPAEAKKAPPVRAVPVAVASVVQKTIPVELKTFGTVEAYATVAIKSQVTGLLTKVHFKEGQTVQEKDLLLEIDRAPFDSALKQAEANLARGQVQAKEAEREATREQELLKKGISAAVDYDKSRATADALAATVRADQAAVVNATIQLGYCTIRSPLTGRAGALLVDEGNLLKANDVPIVVIAQVKPIYATFSLPEQELPQIRKNHSDAKPLEVRVTIPGEDGAPAKGFLAFINNTVDTTTGTIQLKARFPNQDDRLWPGQFVNVVLTVRREEGILVVPTHAVQTGQAGQFVFIVKDDLTVEVRPVVTGRALDRERVVKEGLKAGERVVTDGQLRLVKGAKVEIKTSPTRAEAPKS